MIGKNLYYYDANASRFTDKKGEEAYYVAVPITEETSHSWVGYKHGKKITFNKKDLRVGMQNKSEAINSSSYTEDMVAFNVWKKNNLSTIVAALDTADESKLRRIYSVLFEEWTG